MPARRASLRRVRGRDLLDSAASFVLQTYSEQTPSAGSDGTVKATLLRDQPTGLLSSSLCRTGHRPHVERFDANRVEAPRDLRGGLLDPVLASVLFTRFQLGDHQLRAGPTVGTALGAGQAPLQHFDPPQLARAETRCVQQVTGRQRRRHSNAAVDAHHIPLNWTGDRIGDMGERNVPAARTITGDPVGPHALGDRSRQAESHPAHLGYPHATYPTVQTLDVVRS